MLDHAVLSIVCILRVCMIMCFCFGNSKLTPVFVQGPMIIIIFLVGVFEEVFLYVCSTSRVVFNIIPKFSVVYFYYSIL